MPLRRPLTPMPGWVREALEAKGLIAAFRARPDYQRNDWLGWITAAARPETQKRRAEKMFAELAQGHGYMGMAWQPKPGGARKT